MLMAFDGGALKLKHAIKVQAETIMVDNISNVYTISDDVIKKFDADGNFLKSYTNKNYGKITSIDTWNPMKIVVFYRDFLQMVFLDNTLSQNGDPVSFEALGFPGTTLACNSFDNGFWIYDSQNFALVRFDQNLQKVTETGNLASQLGQDIKPNFILEYDNRLYLNDPSIGIFVFDVFGTYNKTIPINGLDQFQFKSNELIYFQRDKLKSFNLKTLEQDQFALPDSNAINVKVVMNRLYLLKKDELKMY